MICVNSARAKAAGPNREQDLSRGKSVRTVGIAIGRCS
jgi:hypothetical protein